MKTAYIRMPGSLIAGIIFLIGLISIFTLRYFILGQQESYTLSPALFGRSVVIDVGHGGWDPGVSGINGSREADINLAIACKLAEYCRGAGAEVTMTRESDIALAMNKANDMAARVQISKDADADIFVSIHCNSYPGQHGAQVFYEKGNQEAKSLAESIQAQMAAHLANTDRQALPHTNAYLLKNIKAPAVICEVGFLSHPEEEKMLLDLDYQWELAWAIYSGLIEYLNKP